MLPVAGGRAASRECAQRAVPAVVITPRRVAVMRVDCIAYSFPCSYLAGIPQMPAPEG